MFKRKTQFWHPALLWCVLCGLIEPSLTMARMTDVILKELVAMSDVIVFGHISSTVSSDTRSTSGQVRFEVISLLKGGDELRARKDFLLCNHIAIQSYQIYQS